MNPPPITPRTKPLIGLVGGIGSGKSFVADLFAQCGCGVVNSDRIAAQVLESPDILAQLTHWWGGGILLDSGKPNRKAIAQRVFGKPDQVTRLNALIHPRVAEQRIAQTLTYLLDPQIQAVVWDTPLLVEAHLHTDCDVIVFVESTLEQRRARVTSTRGWTDQDLASREAAQLPLDQKRKFADHTVVNTGSADSTRAHVREVLETILKNYR